MGRGGSHPKDYLSSHEFTSEKYSRNNDGPAPGERERERRESKVERAEKS